MRYIIIDNTTGLINQVGTVVSKEEIDILRSVGLNAQVINTEIHIQDYYYDFEDKKLKLLPKKPSQYHVWEKNKWVEKIDLDVEMAKIRAIRDQLLADTDWAILPDVNISNKEEIIEYRQKLRNITENLDPKNIVWPEKPEGIK